MSNTKKIDKSFQKFAALKRSGTLSGRDFKKLLEEIGFETELTADGHYAVWHPALPIELGTVVNLTHGLKGDVPRFYLKKMCSYVEIYKDEIGDYLK